MLVSHQVSYCVASTCIITATWRMGDLIQSKNHRYHHRIDHTGWRTEQHHQPFSYSWSRGPVHRGSMQSTSVTRLDVSDTAAGMHQDFVTVVGWWGV